MTEQDKQELRQIIREELDLRFPLTYQYPMTPICLHDWYTDYSVR